MNIMQNGKMVRARVYALGVLLMAGGLTACEKLLEAEAPQLIEEGSLQQPTNAPVMVSGVVADFECAFASYIATMGAISDEFRDSQANADTWQLDRRTNTPSGGIYATNTCGGFAAYTPVSIARFQADNTARLLSEWTDAEVPGRATLLARAKAYAGYSLILLGEGFCSAAIDVGPELTPAQVFAEAEKRFTDVLSGVAAGSSVSNDSLRNMSLVGRARARINQGKFAEAAADAALVPNNFTFNARYSSTVPRAENRIFRINNTSGSMTVDSTLRGLTVGGVPDPRVNVTDAGRGGSQASVRLWVQNKYPALNTPIPIASWREALLIRAEAAAEAGQVAAAVGFINQLRTRVSLPLFVATTAAEVKAQIPDERRRELFLESHRLYDTIRFNLPLIPAAGAPFQAGGTYGNQKCLPLPDIERLNNPNLS
jgi:starch-binding outer membrane protein, SusD/RagB family